MSKFPVIKHIDDVLDIFKEKKEFVVLDKGEYLVIDYVFSDKDTFSNDILREGRGLKFDRQGNLIGRPFHKFFNLGEKPETMPDALDWTNVFVETKNDGSMIHPVHLHGNIILMTRKGYTDTSRQCEFECDVPYAEMRHYLENGFTPIYEYVSPNNQIVIPYEVPELRLLAVRDMLTGRYLFTRNYTSIISHTKHESVLPFIDDVRGMKGEEGVVLVWPSGERVKLKAEEYVSIHRSIDLAASESRLLEVIYNNKIDDLIPLLSEARAEWVKDFNTKVISLMHTKAKEMDSTCGEWVGASQKEFALFVTSNIQKPLQAAYFRYRLDPMKDPFGCIVKRYSEIFRKQKDVDEYRDLLLDGARLERGGL